MSESEYKNNLTQMILKYYHYSVPGVVWGQLRNYHDKLHMTYEGMYKTYLYVLEVKGLAFDSKYGLGYVKYFYKEGHQYVKRSTVKSASPEVKSLRRKVKIKKQEHKPVLKKIDWEDLD